MDTPSKSHVRMVVRKNVVQMTFVCASEELAAQVAKTFAEILHKYDPDAQLSIITSMEPE
jgi:hypothetical protein